MIMLASIFDTVTGLPVHILVVHAVVVLVPLCFVGVLVAAVSTSWRQKLAVPILVLLAIGFLASLVAIKSGKSLRSRIGASPAINHHAHIGVWVPVFVVVALALTWAWLVAEERAGNITLWSDAPVVPSMPVSGAPSSTVRLTACALAVVSCALATGWIAYTGDAGSRAVWKPIIQATNHK
jgi:hypothetical protein